MPRIPVYPFAWPTFWHTATLLNMSLKSFVKGWIGEAVGSVAHKLLLDPKIYFPLNNVTLQTRNGTTQIDHVIVSKYGIFVIESKNMDGWIFGDAKSPQWTQSLFGKKYRFQNPLHQNYRHIKVLQEFLGVEESKETPNKPLKNLAALQY